MADYAIGLGFHKANRTLVRAVALEPPCRYFAERSGTGFITLPLLDPGSEYIELQGITQSSFSINDNNQEFRLLGDDGWTDSVITGASVQASITSYFMKDTTIPIGQECPVFRGRYDEGFNLIQRARYDKDYEIYIEFLKELGPVNGSSGNWIYDFTGFNAVMSNYQEQTDPQGLTQVSFNLMSRGRPVFGRYDAGTNALSFGGVQMTLLETSLTTGVRRYSINPVDGYTTQYKNVGPVITYKDNFNAALQYLSLARTDGGGFTLTRNDTGDVVPLVPSLNTTTATLNLGLGNGLVGDKQYTLKVADGAVRQLVNNKGIASATGKNTGLQGFTSSFTTIDAEDI